MRIRFFRHFPEKIVACGTDFPILPSRLLDPFLYKLKRFYAMLYGTGFERVHSDKGSFVVPYEIFYPREKQVTRRIKVVLPDHLKSYQRNAMKLLEQDLVKDVEFSGSTYQVLVQDPSSGEAFWVFLQLDGKGNIRDGFCSCEEGHERTGCVHLALAYLSLFKNYSQPLHQRFARSLWNHLCRLYENRLGGNPEVLQIPEPGRYLSKSRQGKTIFEMHALTDDSKTALHRMIFDRQTETEENSLKFSGLSPEEISCWKEGRPPARLRYDLSFWSDLAKRLMKKQEDGEPYRLIFKYSKKNLPNWFQVNFGDVEVGFYVSRANLPVIIDSLKTVESTLSVYHADKKEIGKITYDKEEQILRIVETVEENPLESKRDHSIQKAEAIPLEGWKFIPGDGFYAEESHELLQIPMLHGEEIAHALTEHTRLISSLIVDCPVHRDPVTLSYRLSFDIDWNLHLYAYLFEPEDLERGNSWLIENWAYLEDEGFFPVEGNLFENIETSIPSSGVSDFVTRNRIWLNEQEGFHTHLRSFEYQLTYRVSQGRRLTFSRNLVPTKEQTTLQDFGVWVYCENYGFYSKTSGSFNYLLKPGVSLSPEQIPLFIKMNYEEVALIPGFFNSRCPVEAAGLRIELSDKRKVTISPEYRLLPDCAGKTPLMFDDFVFLEGEGFCELPLDLRLPEKFHSSVELEGEELDFFLFHELDQLEKIAVYIDPRLRRPEECRLVAAGIQRVEERGRGWFRFRCFYRTNQGLIPLASLKQAFNKKLSFAFFDAGLIDLREKRFDWLRLLEKNRFEKGNDSIILSSLDFMRLNAFDPLELLNDGPTPSDEQTVGLFRELTELSTPSKPDIGGLISHLRPYQEIGAEWLWFLYSHRLSGILCDDMGLGKTHQAMALIAGAANLHRSYAEGGKCLFLIVCPTSVIYHWQEKLHAFLPGLRVYTFYGANRALDAFSDRYDILLTSYGILRNERETIGETFFEAAIFDEIQIAKNQFSRVYSALRSIKAGMKLGLTGTPIENRLRELKSLFDIVLPGYMPGEQEYRDQFIRPVEKEQNHRKKILLNRLIHPFVLRRKKEDVLTDLPEKIEEVSYCDLTSYQSELYSEVLIKRRHHLLEELRDPENAVPYLHIFALLSNLKQICDHPAVYLKNPGGYREYGSGKWNLFIELLREARESGQKTVVFSQYLGMLDIIENYLEVHSIGFASLRGSTRDRKEQLRRFNSDPSCEVFVGSLHAAGLGIDLTAASVVIHYDRWWNAARENQATDRVHRMGQTRGVQVFKLVCKGTFEEKIDAMIERKGLLMEDVVGTDDQNTLKVFSRDELIELLEFSERDHERFSDDESVEMQ